MSDNKKIFFGLAALAVALGAKKADAQTNNNGGGGTTPTTPTATPATPTTEEALIEGGKAVVGAAVSAGGAAIVAWGKAQLSALLGGTSGTTSTTTAAGTATAGAGGSSTSTTTAAGGTAGSTSSSPASIAVAAEVSGGVVVLGFIAIVVIACVVSDAIIRANKALRHKIDALRPNARDMHEFEKFLWINFREKNEFGGTFTQVDVRDPRLDARIYAEGQELGVVRQGWRTCVNYVPGPPATHSYVPLPAGAIGEPNYPWTAWRAPWMGGDQPNVALLRAFKQFRRVALEYMSHRGFFFSNLMVGWMQKPPYAFGSGVLDGLYEYMQAGYGGLNQIPLLDGQTEWNAAHGRTASGRQPGSDPTGVAWNNVVFPPAEMMRARDASPDDSFANTAAGDQILKMARFRALLDCMAIFAADPQIFLVFDPYLYTQVAYQRLGLNSDLASLGTKTQAEPFMGWTIVTNPAYFGVRAALDIPAFKGRTAGFDSKEFKMMAMGIRQGDKRLNNWWEI